LGFQWLGIDVTCDVGFTWGRVSTSDGVEVGGFGFLRLFGLPGATS
jgi:hypothetical protein